MYTINSLTGYLKSLGHKVPKTTVAGFLNWFEDSHFLFTVKLYDASANRSNVNPKKIYCIDHSMVRSVSSGILVNSGHLLENLVFNALRPVAPDIFYYRTKSGKEVDFIFKRETGGWELVQVSETLSQEQTRLREIIALEEAMSETGIQSAIIVTRSEEEEFLSDAGPIRIIPAWKFLLETTLAANVSVQN